MIIIMRNLVNTSLKKVGKLLAIIISIEFLGSLGAIVTTPSISTWYVFLEKPVFTPPNWLFGPAWAFLYFLMGVSLYLILEKGIKNRSVKSALFFFSIQFFFNILWSFIFFGAKLPLIALFDIIILILLLIKTIVVFYKISRSSAYLLFPYLFWVIFATALNFSIVVLN